MSRFPTTMDCAQPPDSELLDLAHGKALDEWGEDNVLSITWYQPIEQITIGVVTLDDTQLIFANANAVRAHLDRTKKPGEWYPISHGGPLHYQVVDGDNPGRITPMCGGFTSKGYTTGSRRHGQKADGFKYCRTCLAKSGTTLSGAIL